MYKVSRVSPKYSKSDNKLIGYSILVRREWSDFNYSDFFTVEDMQKLYWVNNLDQAEQLVWKSVNLKTTIEIIK